MKQYNAKVKKEVINDILNKKRTLSETHKKHKIPKSTIRGWIAKKDTKPKEKTLKTEDKFKVKSLQTIVDAVKVNKNLIAVIGTPKEIASMLNQIN